MSSSSPPSSATPVARVIARIVRAVVGVGVLAAGLGVAGMLVATRPEAPRASRATPVMQVRTMPATESEVPRLWEGYGTARPMRVAQIPAQVSGTVIERPPEVEAGRAINARVIERGSTSTGLPADGPAGDGAGAAGALLASVEAAAAGGLIVRIDPSDYLSRLTSALEQAAATRAQIESLQVQETRAREMAGLAREEREIQEREVGRLIEAIAQGGGNDSEVERRRGLLLAAQRNETILLDQIDRISPRRAELEAILREQASGADVARQNLARTVVTSPIAGVLQEILYRPGEWAQAGTTIARVVDLSRIEVPLRVPVSASAEVGPGDAATLRIDNGSGREWHGRVVRLSPEADAATRTLTVYVEVDQAVGGAEGRGLLLPGQFVVGRIQSSRTERVVLVPRRAVAEDTVFIAASEVGEDGSRVTVARRARVEVLFNLVGDRPDLDPVETQWSAVRAGAGLVAGSAVIVSNLDDLHDGLLVGVAPAAGASAAGSAGAERGGTP